MYLNCKTYFSLRYGTFSTEDLVKTAAEQGISSLAITNINCVSDAWDFYQHCRANGIRPILGTEIRNGDKFCYILLAANATGFEWINSFLSAHLQEAIPFPETAAERHFFDNPADGFVIYPLESKEPENLYTNEYIGIKPAHITKLFSFPLQEFRHKLVVLHPVSFQDKKHYNAHRLLRAIHHNTLLSRLAPEQQAAPDEMFLPPARLIAFYAQYPFIVTNTYRLMESCNLEMEFHTDKNKKTFSATAEDDRIFLAKLAIDGCHQRYGKRNKTAMERVKKELAIINQLGFNAYFLITRDIIRYAQGRGYYYVGRGSGANSIVAYCLQITDVDPIELDLYFERFLNPYRTSPPDFDIDFSWLDRDDVIDYVFKRYGKKQVALLGMVTTFQYNALIRELGKVFGLPKAEIDQLAVKGYYSRNHSFASKKAEDHIQQLILQYGSMLVNFPNHLSIHPGGMLVSEAPVCRYTAVYMPPKGFPTAQIDMFVAENVGLYKLDILSQRGLGHIKEAIRLVRENRQVSINIHEIERFKKDPGVKAQIKKVDTIGCFYIESPAMRQLLKKLECDDYLTLVAASSIIRPGVASSGMMKAYIERYHKPDSFEYIHPVMKELLEETYGVMVYQEDVIKVAHHFAGLDMGEADILRRAMSGKYRGNKEMIRIKEKFFANCRERGYEDAISQEVWRQIESFGGYSFSKAHSASFAVESYQSLYLKTYFPKEFMVAVINNFGGFYSRELYFYELHRTGACIHPPCVNNSDWFTNIRGNDVYVGFIHLKSLEQSIAETIIEERKKYGTFLHVQDLIERTAIGKESLNILIRINALRFTGRTKKQLLWEANMLHSHQQAKTPVKAALFREPPIHFELPELPHYPLEELYDQMELLGFTLHNPFPLADDDPGKYVAAADISSHKGNIITVLGYLITYKPVRTIKGDTMCFGTFIDMHLDWIDTVHFPDSLARYPLNGNGFYRMTGKVIEDFGVYNLEVHEMKKVGLRTRTAHSPIHPFTH
ncbi:DNA polymerase III subunit alpha [Flavihumibacter stibioxidans]|uniref:DNA-directed DNA polymerase n=1 Tax=Flavihumibacter stibioxidans TaxID=1834163 RepID=A0ABR7MCL9_9BACT|nr:DNA polymerase III subunit alpha [Flavihumibacter stibioxidans]MBC6492490.1 DNA polymerase III subunit alpha [Flavihumibacter stibioxidans]